MRFIFFFFPWGAEPVLRPPWGAGHPWVLGHRSWSSKPSPAHPAMNIHPLCQGDHLTKTSPSAHWGLIRPFNPFCLIFEDGKRWRQGWGWAHTWSLVWDQLFTPWGSLLEEIIKSHVKTSFKASFLYFLRPERKGGGTVWVEGAHGHHWGEMEGVWSSGKELRCPWVWFGHTGITAQPRPPAASPLPPFEAAAGLEFSRTPR